MKMQLGRIAVTLLLLAAVGAVAGIAQQAGEKTLWQPFYVDARSGAQHLSLDGAWQFASRDTGIAAVSELQPQKWLKAQVPTSVQWALYQAGELPYPYAHLNTQKYKWVPQKVWYFRRQFDLPAAAKDDYVFLCFDGAGYFTRIWLNGTLVGRHEGMFGGPHVEVGKWLQPGASNDIVVEVKAGSYGEKTWDPDNYGNGKTAEPWGVNGGQKYVTGGSGIDPREIEPLGIWQGVRLEMTPKVHLARPFLITQKASGTSATLKLKVEVLADTTALDTKIQEEFGYIRDSAVEAPEQKDLSLQMELVEKGSARVAFTKAWPVKAQQGRNWIEEQVDVPNPKLWWPNGMGDPNLYTVRVTLLRQQKAIDRLDFDYGIRTIERVATPGPKTQDRWENWQFIVNGRPFFVKGMNWAWPLDVLLNLPADRYKLLLTQVQAAHIQMLRVWGGGNTETDDFFKLCDKLGIMVWEDFPLANADAPLLPQDVWETQVMHTIFRLRNHPALAVWCGGNEFNPYDAGNSAAIGIVERSVRDFDGTRMFIRTTPDPGDVHIYYDQDPTWYGHRYKTVPYISETGIYNMPDADSVLEVVDGSELKGGFNTIFDKGYQEQHPDFIHHFLEYVGGEPRLMWARAYQVDDLAKVDLKGFSESSQMAASEFTQILADLTQANYPETAGLMPWSFTVPWPIEFFMFVDGLNQPTSSYYTIKRAYEPTHVVVKLPELLWAKGEKVPIAVSVVHSPAAGLTGVNVSVEILDPAFKSLWKKTQPMNVPAGPSAKSIEMGAFTIPDSLEDKFFFVVAEARSADGKLLLRSVYWPRCLKLMNDAAFRAKYRGSPQPSLKFEKGPWLRPQVAATQTELALKVISRKDVSETESVVKVEVRNTGKTPAFETHLNIAGTKRTFWGTDNDLWLPAGETKTIDLNIQWKDAATKGAAVVTVDAWNAALQQSAVPAVK
jgi:beta-mannosidase